MSARKQGAGKACTAWTASSASVTCTTITPTLHKPKSRKVWAWFFKYTGEYSARPSMKTKKDCEDFFKTLAYTGYPVRVEIREVLPRRGRKSREEGR